ncbi:hypothetical protein [Spiroplasma ixodetis]|uniref:hypothetical protein n=1 Tax=Spiroplasma ixodetis TaxID=2141 RepID=UPI002578916E|nr:hypothetical protein [Spiroplasma ixodetis]WJG69329.1 hypothetical protein SIXOD_v1c01720 [Spiroplasma ixodetis Y32]WJG70623.1 hypothetical protein SIXOD_v1c18150 [Spiroplasma ixodetis Y32]WJG70673.1 hypothetical protein SIXOD_v1c18820 [Spiroplasma ixodetis Y32]WJG71249.1 hypothetical protein SIXOD_v1c26260 [Spiroplasma ixodetis Y32]
MPNTENSQSNYTLLKLIRTGIAPLSAMIGTSAYYGQLIGNPILGSINALLFSKKLGIDIWNLNQMPSTKTKLLNSSKKILLGLGTIGLVNYEKFTNADINPNPTESPTTTTTVDPFPDLLFSTNNNSIDNHLMDWDTFISLNSYGIANLIAGITEIIPSKFETIRKIANMATGGCLISSGVAMGINNDFTNAYAIPTIVAGASEIIHNLLPMEINHVNTEMQETPFTNEHANLINNTEQEYERQRQTYGSNDSIDSLTSDVLYERRPVYASTTVPINRI